MTRKEKLNVMYNNFESMYLHYLHGQIFHLYNYVHSYNYSVTRFLTKTIKEDDEIFNCGKILKLSHFQFANNFIASKIKVLLINFIDQYYTL